MTIDNIPPKNTNLITCHKGTFFLILSSKKRNNVDIGTAKEPEKINPGTSFVLSKYL